MVVWALSLQILEVFGEWGPSQGQPARLAALILEPCLEVCHIFESSKYDDM